MRTAEWGDKFDLTDMKQQNVLCPYEQKMKNERSEDQVQTKDTLDTVPSLKILTQAPNAGLKQNSTLQTSCFLFCNDLVGVQECPFVCMLPCYLHCMLLLASGSANH